MKGFWIWKDYIKKFKSIRFFSMMLLAFLNVLVIVLIAVSSYAVYRNSLLNVIGTNRSDVLSQIGSRIKDLKSNAFTISNLYYNDETFMSYTKNLNEDNAKEFYMYMDNLTYKYKVSFNQINFDYDVVYISKNGIGYYSNSVPDDYDYMDPEIRIWYKDIYEAHGDIVDIACYKDNMLGINSFVAARTVLNNDGEIVGYLMINVNEQQIFNTYTKVISPNSNIYIADNDGNIISSNISKIVGFHYFNMKNLKMLFDSNVYAIVHKPYADALFSKYEDIAYNFTVFEETPLDYILRPIQTTGNIVIVITLCVTLFGVFLAWLLSGKITRPIMKIRDYVLQVENGNMDATISLNSYTEINTLSLGIMQMLARIRNLMDSERKKEEQKRKMHYNLLQAQINPHFIYNTLFSIKCAVDMNENEKASQMLATFIQLLRSTLYNPDTMSTVRHQMEALKQYVKLYKFLYGNCFEVIIEYDDNIANCLLPQLLVQPLVENAIIHGVGFKNTYGVIAVSVCIKNEKIVIEVEDNGIGMTTEQADKVMNNDDNYGKPHIGIKNIHDRIKLLYGDEYGLLIDSKPDDGTKILLCMPIIRKKGVDTS